MPEGHERYSAGPLTEDERQRLRRDLDLMERLEPLLKSYENGRTIMKFFLIVGAWLVGAVTFAMGLLAALQTFRWWPFGGG